MAGSRRRHLRRIGTLVALLLGTLVGCTGSASEAPLTIAASASMAPVMGELQALLAERAGVETLVSYGSTANLAQQIRNGAPFDVFLAADALHIDELIEEGFLEASSRIVFARGRLVLARARSESVSVTTIQAVTDPMVRQIALANPSFAPYGLAAQQALQRADLWDQVEPKLIYAESVRQAGQLVSSGNATVGFLAASTNLSLGLEALELPAELYDPIQHVAGIRIGAERREEASAFLATLVSEEAAAILRRLGLDPVQP